MFSLHLLSSNTTFTIPIPRGFSPAFLYSSGTITPKGLLFLLEQVFFSNEISSGFIKCDDFKLLFELFGHTDNIRDSIWIKTTYTSRELKKCSNNFDHTYIEKDNYLTQEAIKLVVPEFQTAWLEIINYHKVFLEYYEHCVIRVSRPLTQQSTLRTKEWCTERNQHVLTASTASLLVRNDIHIPPNLINSSFFIQKLKDLETNISKLKLVAEIIFPQTSEKKLQE